MHLDKAVNLYQHNIHVGVIVITSHVFSHGVSGMCPVRK